MFSTIRQFPDGLTIRLMRAIGNPSTAILAIGRAVPIGIADGGIAIVKSRICLTGILMIQGAGAIFLPGLVLRCQRLLLCTAAAAKSTQPCHQDQEAANIFLRLVQVGADFRYMTDINDTHQHNGAQKGQKRVVFELADNVGHIGSCAMGLAGVWI